MKKLCLLLVFSLGITHLTQAQLTVADTIPKFDLLQTLFGGGVIVSNLQVTCDTTVAMWEFDGTNSNIGLNRGVLISSGEASDAVPTAAAACNNVASTSLGQPGYGPLNSLIPGFTTNDACVITFDILPYCDTIGIRYVFASEEYPEYVNTSFNDVFAFFISGPGFGPPPGQNIALIPGTTQAVSIDNVNNGNTTNCSTPTGPCTNCAYYIDNAQGTTVAYDAFTIPLLAQAVVTACETYTVTLAVADAGDYILDSGVFLEAGGIGCTSTVLALKATNNTALGSNVAIEDCVDGVFSFSIPAPLSDTVVFTYNVGGTATPGVDYSALPDSIVMLPGQTTVSVPVTIYNDSIAEGLEFIEIIYTDSALCATQVYADTAVLQIFDAPSMYQPSDHSLCSDDTISIGIPTSPGQDYNWSPALGLSATNVANPALSLSNSSTVPLTFNYVLTTTTVLGLCEYKDTITVTVHPANQADFIADTVCDGYAMGFVDLTYADSIVSWDWDFGDGSFDSQQNPGHLYNQPGVYNVELITLNASGCPDTVSYPVLVNSLPDVQYAANPVCDGSQMQFVHVPEPGVDYQWDFGDNNGATLALPDHLFGSYGSYLTELVATTAQGCADSSSVNVTVYQNPSAIFAVEDVCFGFNANFQNQSQNGTGTVLNYYWDFGDGSSPVTTASPSYGYNSFGLYNTSLIITDENGCTDQIVQDVEIFPAVDAQFNYTPICFGDTTPFLDLSGFDASGPIDNWNWQFGDGKRSNLQSPTHYYGSYGSYNVQLNVTSVDGCTDSILSAIEVYDQPIAEFVFASDCEEQAIPFQNLSRFNNTQVTWGWDYDDQGNASNQQNPAYVFSSWGTFDVSLTVTNDDGCADTYVRPVEIWPLPTADFSLDPACRGEEFIVLNESSVPGNAIIGKNLWDLGDGRARGTKDLDIRYSQPGTYAVSLWVQTQDGCADSLTRSIDVYPLPQVDFGHWNACARDSFWFENRSSIDNSLFNDKIVDWTWNWGDGSQPTGALPEPGHVYAEDGTYPVTLTVFSDKGCESSFTREAIAWPLPLSPVIEGDSVCFGDQALLIATSVPPTERVDWYYGPSGGDPFFTGNAYVSPPQVFNNLYYVEPVTDKDCRVGRFPVIITLRNPGEGSLQVSDSVVETPNALVNFEIAGTIAGADYDWNFGDGQKSKSASPSHEYQYPGRYEVSVRIIDRFGCESLLKTVVEVKEYITLYVPSGFSPNGDGINDVLYIGHKLLNQFQFNVFNRWGQLVFQTDNSDFSWDGHDLNGQMLPEGVYAFHTQAVDIHGNLVEKTGTITIFR